MRHATTLLALTLLSTGCAHTHLERNAPGYGGIEERPPEDITAGQRIEPGDPGENVLLFNAGLASGGGLAIRDSGVDGAYALGLEATAKLGQSDRSHFDDAFFIYPSTNVGLSLGYVPIHVLDDAGRGPFYVEAQIEHEAIGLALGYRANVLGERAHGPQITTWLGPLSLRVNHHLVGETFTEVQLGLLIKIPAGMFIWSR